MRWKTASARSQLMSLELFNSLTRKVEPFEPMQPGRVSMYVCGMTPSFHPHLGHARTFLTFDVLLRYLRTKGLDVTYIRNVTDIDDRIIDRAKTEGVPWDDVVTRYYGEFERCATALGLLEPSLSPRATREMPEIVSLIERLVGLGVAYETSDGVYFAVERDSQYGSLSRRNLDELRAGERIAVREEKRDPLDFALWKKAKPGEPTWESPWGPGRPGWHIECSAMCKRYLGDQFDIHGGAMDLIFPHHENEVAQTETASGKRPMARFWIHPGLLNVEGQKMSKSLGNFSPLTEVLRQHPGAAVRYLFLQTGYRKPSNYTTAALEAASRGLRGLYGELDTLRAAAAHAEPSKAKTSAQTAAFEAFLDDDLNTAGALGWLQTQVREGSALAATNPDDASRIVELAEYCLGILGLPKSAQEAGWAVARRVELTADHRERLRALAGNGELDGAELVDRIMALRSEARAKKNFATSDRLREALVAAGIAVKDIGSGSEWSFDGGR
jgi:cysteinyl-tRNA synthetase